MAITHTESTHWPAQNGPALGLSQVAPDDTCPQPTFLAVDHCLPIAPGTALVQGWLLDPGRRMVSLLAQADQAAVTLFPSKALHERTDVDQGMREHYTKLGQVLPDRTGRGFVVLVPHGEKARRVHLIARLNDGSERRWDMQIATKPEAQANLLRDRGYWLHSALAALFRAGARPPVELMTLLHREGVMAHPDVRLEFDANLHFGGGAYLAGWGIGADHVRLSNFFVLTGDPQQPVLYPDFARIARPDVVQHLKGIRRVKDTDLGFVGWLPEAPATAGDLAWTIGCADGQGRLVLRSVTVRDGTDLETTEVSLLHSVPLHNPAFREIYARHTGPALNAFYGPRRERERPPVRTMHFGTPPEHPKVSIIVPLYGRWDFMEYQIAQFRHDASLRQHELIYFVDDPAIYDGIVQYWRNTWPLYEFPFTLACTGENHGFAGANNAAISVARGRQVLLLNSDVIPTGPDWLQPLVTALATQPAAGVVGPTLLYGDGAVQHAGMAFERYPHWGNLWTNLHPGKGWPASWVAGDRPREVPALTGACMLMDRELYNRLGGLDEGYIRGDFEDSDLCLKIREAGLIPYLVPQVKLYHLERQSQDINSRMDTRTLLTIYNCWRHTTRWDAVLERVTREVLL